MRVLITGHLGFIGAVMVPLVQKAGHDVTGLGIGLYDGCDFGPPSAPIHASFSREGGVGRFLFLSPCSNYGAAGDTVLDENSPSIGSRRTVFVRAEGDLLKLVSERFPPVLLRGATACGASPQLRCDIVAQQSRRSCRPNGKGADQERWYALAAERSHRRHLPRPHRRVRGAA
jgi:hypothetical protein